MDRRGYDTGRKDGIAEFEGCISAAMEAFVEGAAEVTQGVEIVGGSHG